MWRVVRQGLYFCCAIILGVLLYILILKLCLFVTDTELGSYQGINEMGKFSLWEIPRLLYHTVRVFFRMPLDNYAALAQIKLLKLAYVCVDIATPAIIAAVAVVRKKKPGQIALLLLLLLVSPLAVNFIMVMCPDSNIHTPMVYSFAIVPCVPLILAEAFPPLTGLRAKLGAASKSVAAFLLVVIVICNSYMGNVNYTASYYSNRQAENYFTSMITQIKATENFDTEKKWAFIGTPYDPILNNGWQWVPPRYEGHPDTQYLVSTHIWWFWTYMYGGYTPPQATAEEIAQLQSCEEVKNMPCWPNEGSIQVIGEFVVIKHSD